MFEFMTADFKSLIADDAPEAVAELEWLLPTASALVEGEAARLGISEWQLFPRRHEVESLRVQRALDILDAGGFIAPDPVD